ncbi:MAG: hypothetical protein ACFB0G_18405 [Leptolyngbyaceae cyanobacterium]
MARQRHGPLLFNHGFAQVPASAPLQVFSQPEIVSLATPHQLYTSLTYGDYPQSQTRLLRFISLRDVSR